jgi:hypothetical protein
VVPVIHTYIDRLQHLVFGRLLKGAVNRRDQEFTFENHGQRQPEAIAPSSDRS